MVIQMISGLLLIFALTFTTLSTMVAVEQARTHAVRDSFAKVVMEQAKVQLVTAAQNEVQNQRPFAVPTFSPVPLCSSQPCAYSSLVTYTVEGSTTAGSTGQNVQTALNVNQTVNEVVQSVQIVAQVLDTTDAITHSVVSQRTGMATIGTFTGAPYAKLTGFTDTTGNPTQRLNEPDTSGCDPSNPTACAPAAVATPDDTRIQATNTRCVDSGQWVCAGASPEPSPSNNYQNIQWTNGNQ
jgi:hypothetical protein